MIISELKHANTVSMNFAGSSHSDKELDTLAADKNSKVVEKRKRKRKADDSNSDKVINGKQAARTPTESKKINDYFVKHSGSSPVRHGTKPSSPAHQPPHALVSIFTLS